MGADFMPLYENPNYLLPTSLKLLKRARSERKKKSL
jgi:hypothetical protein